MGRKPVICIHGDSFQPKEGKTKFNKYESRERLEENSELVIEPYQHSLPK